MSEQATPGREYNRLYRRALATLLLLAITPLVALGVFSLNRLNTIYDEKITAGIEALTSSKCRALDTFISERVAQIRQLTFTHGYDELTHQARLSEIFSVLQNNGRSFVDIGIIGLDGRHEAYVGPYDLKNADYHEAAWFAEVLRRGTYVSDVFLGVRKVPHFIIAVMRHEGNRSYIMRATIDMEPVTDLLKRTHSGSNADAFLVSGDGVLQSDSLYYGNVMDKLPFPVSGVVRGRIDIRELSEDNGSDGHVKLLAACVHMTTMPWVLVVADDVRQSLVQLRNLRLLILAFVVVGSILVAIGSFAATRKLVGFIQEKDRQQANIDARLMQSSKMAALGKMAAGVAHEVNNPLMLIQENAGWIADLMDDEDRTHMKNFDEIVTSCQKIMANVQRARGITQRMLGFGRRMNPGRAEVMMGVVADHVIELLQTEATGHNVTIDRKYGSDVPVILSDPAQLEQVVLNIVDNAIDAIGHDGKVTISTSAAPGGGARITISDTGPGLSPELMARIFDPFFTTKAVGEGTGLGLAICYSILQKLGGHIDVASKPGKGTTFTVTMPPEPPQPEQEVAAEFAEEVGKASSAG